MITAALYPGSWALGTVGRGGSERQEESDAAGILRKLTSDGQLRGEYSEGLRVSAFEEEAEEDLRRKGISPEWERWAGTCPLTPSEAWFFLLGSEDLGAHGEQRRARIMREGTSLVVHGKESGLQRSRYGFDPWSGK